MSKEKNFMETYRDLIKEKIEREIEMRPYQLQKFEYDPENCSKGREAGPGICFVVKEKTLQFKAFKIRYYFPIKEYPTPRELFEGLEKELMMFELKKISQDVNSREQAVILCWDSTTITFRPAGKLYRNKPEYEFSILINDIFDESFNLDVDGFFQKTEAIIVEKVDNHQRYEPPVYRGSAGNYSSKRIIPHLKFDYQDIEQALNSNTENNLETQFSKFTMDSLGNV